MSPLESFIALASLLLSLTIASPTDLVISQLSTNAQPLVNSTNPWIKVTNATDSSNDRNNQCDPSGVWDTFEGTTDPSKSPLISDCLMINHNIKKGGRWEVEAVVHSSHQLVQYGTCAFRVKAVKPYHDSFFYVGNADIMDLITDSVARFGRDEVVGATGRMHCRAAAWGSIVQWEIVFNS